MAKKRKAEKKSKTEKKKSKTEKKKSEKMPENESSPTLANDSEQEEPQEEAIQKLLEPFSKEQLIDLLTDAALSDESIFRSIKQTADKDVSHRKVFVHGFGWDTTRELLLTEFQKFGEVEDCHVVVDKVTGRAKGFGFVLFKHRLGAAKALEQPQKKIKNRVASCQLASIGPVPVPVASNPADTTGRKIYVSNVAANTNAEKLKAFFGRFGEIEEGPIGFDRVTGLSRGYALFVYKTLEGAKKVLEEPYKMFEGNQLHCKKALEGDAKTKFWQHGQQQVSNLDPADLALLGLNHNAGFNTGISALMANPSAGFGLNQPVYGAGSLNPMVAATSSFTSMGSYGQGFGGYGGAQLGTSMGSYGQGLGGYGGAQLGLDPSVLGAYGGSQATTLQGLQSYPQLGQSSARSSANGSSFGGFQSYV